MTTTGRFPWRDEERCRMFARIAAGGRRGTGWNSGTISFPARSRDDNRASRANFATAFGFWGNSLLGFALPGEFGGTPGRAVGNVDTIYQMDNDPALTAAEQALNTVVLSAS